MWRGGCFFDYWKQKVWNILGRWYFSATRQKSPGPTPEFNISLRGSHRISKGNIELFDYWKQNKSKLFPGEYFIVLGGCSPPLSGHNWIQIWIFQLKFLCEYDFSNSNLSLKIFVNKFFPNSNLTYGRWPLIFFYQSNNSIFIILSFTTFIIWSHQLAKYIKF